jgi:hypothetical protein
MPCNEEAEMTRFPMVVALLLAAGCFGGSGTAPGAGTGSGSGSASPPGGAGSSGGGVAGTVSSAPVRDPTGAAGTGGGGATAGTGGSDLPGVCTLPREVGPCRAVIPRYYFDTASDRCMMFNYGGCDGNENNFVSLEACNEVCAQGTDPGTGTVCPPAEDYCKYLCAGEPAPGVDPACDLPPCACGGGGGPGALDPVCLLPRESGPCDAAFARWGYVPDSGKCELFTYGGCEGNANNFETEEECAAKCGGGADVPEACGNGVPLDPNVMCEGTIAMKMCFADASEACACLGCPDTCEILESWPQVARCP